MVRTKKQLQEAYIAGIIWGIVILFIFYSNNWFNVVWKGYSVLVWIIIFAWVKEGLDFLNIRVREAESFLHPWFEHAPFILFIGIYCLSINQNSLALASFLNLLVDLYQDRIYKYL